MDNIRTINDGLETFTNAAQNFQNRLSDNPGDTSAARQNVENLVDELEAFRGTLAQYADSDSGLTEYNFSYQTDGAGNIVDHFGNQSPSNKVAWAIGSGHNDPQPTNYGILDAARNTMTQLELADTNLDLAESYPEYSQERLDHISEAYELLAGARYNMDDMRERLGNPRAE
jgi:hypothetical protein